MRSLLLILLSVGLLWARSSYSKFTSGTFVNSLGGTLSKIIDKNPYPPFKQFLENMVIPNSQLFGFLVLWGEILTALAITSGAILLLINSNAGRFINLLLIGGLIGGVFLNIIFWLGFGHTSPSTDSLNLLMATVQIIGIVFLLKQLG